MTRLQSALILGIVSSTLVACGSELVDDLFHGGHHGPGPGSTDGGSSGQRCGGNTANPPKCPAGFDCVPDPANAGLPFGDVGGICVKAAAAPQRCGGIAGIRCPGGGKCVDDPNDSCDPAAGGADCGGICQCIQTVACIKGAVFDHSPQVCACVTSGITGP